MIQFDVKRGSLLHFKIFSCNSAQNRIECRPLVVNREFTLKSEEACLTGAAGGEEAEESLDGEASEAVVILSDAGDGGGDEAAVTSVVVIVTLSEVCSSLESPFSSSSGSSLIARTLTHAAGGFA